MTRTRALFALSAASLAAFAVALGAMTTSWPLAALVASLAAAGLAWAMLAPAVRERATLASRVRDLEQSLAAAESERGQKELLFRTVVESAPMSIVVYGDTGGILYSNAEAREMFFEGRTLDGHDFLKLLKDAPEPLRQAILTENDLLFTVDQEGEAGTYHLAKRYFDIRGESHTLLMVKHLTQELARQEIEVWKKVIRIINHELNNSLAPISSMVHSAKLIAQNPEQLPKLTRVFDTIEERTKHLASFLEGYARFARLPKPRQTEVVWGPFLDGVRAIFPNVRFADPPKAPGWFDPAQMQQALLNVVKNAEEAGGEPATVELGIESQDGGTRIFVSDRGKGMTDEVLKNALVPFFSTKEKGTGLGLALCREIVEAHRGKLRIARREGGGIVVSCWLPGRETTPAPHAGRLTLTRS
jgi:two-component system, NtrC family, nitrogen regulation sensor histidine kinase NtrY